ncbi:response regulator transcription factor [Paenibacillus piri]|uniref:Helix-turn-helix domain-containing protein n=1 Tax=Paenibacillus piri TaxID=2547395 RepID=A0A4R5K6R3_9BACL|nr:helix-turn-helix domain-containing protein [Paenibacillus piri]TDF89805.1 helix-turn-helix domain-containing protein [Paenibacillus piri]
MKIVICDDEQLAREALSIVLLELYPDLQIYEARNGRELIEVTERIQPEAAFVDIRMPGKSGLEAIQEAAPLSLHTQWIIVTGFADFQYAQEALRLQAIEYLLKPVEIHDLRNLLTKIRQTALLQIIERNKLFESDMLYLFHGLIDEQKEEDPTINTSGRLRCQIIYMDSCYSETEKSVAVKLFFNTIRTTMSRHYHKDLELATLILPNGDWAVVGRYTTSLGAEQLDNIFSSHSELVQRVEEPGLAFTLVGSEQCNSYTALLDEVTEINNISHFRCSLGISRSWTKEDLLKAQSQPIISRQCHTLIKAVDEYHKGHYVGYMDTIGQFIKNYHEQQDSLIENTRAFSRFLNCSINAPVLVPAKEEEWFESLKNVGENLLDKKIRQTEPKTDLVTKTIAYIENHYSGDITLGRVAEQFSVTPNHLSSLFHKRTGTTFMQYVTKLRMLKAKELLSDPSIQVQQAAEQVGYFSSRHFTKLFKEFFECYPSEFKKQIQMKE